MTSNLNRESETAFLTDLADLNLLRDPNIEDEWHALDFIKQHNTIKKEQVYRFNAEILNNIFFFTETNSRRAYLNRLLLILTATEQRLRQNASVFLEGSWAPVRVVRPPAKPYELSHDQVHSFFAQSIHHLERLIVTVQHYVQAETGGMQAPEEVVSVAKTSKLSWTGTPQEFGAIFSKLIEQGYIPKIKNMKYTVQQLSQHFEMKDADGKEATEGNLYKCFIERPKAYFPHEFQLIKSDNYGKGQ